MLLDKIITALVSEIKNYNSKIVFRALEIGALDVGHKEKFHKILEYFPGSEIIGFEVDENTCEKLNSQAKNGIKYFPNALGLKKETRTFYETNAPMCCSLYKPNDRLLRLYNNLEVSYLRKESKIDTIDLDTFIEENSIGIIDFIKIDVEGAELEIFKGGIRTLKDITFIVSEVEFIQHHDNQPLFGEISKFLSQSDFMFHKFLGLAGRTLKPLILNDEPHFASQHIWSDAVFIRDILKIRNLTSDQLLKLSVFASLYESLDLTYFCLNQHDKIFSTNFKKIFKSY